jgi:hypothetical protein
MKTSILKSLSLGVAAGAILLCSTQVQAQTGTMNAPMTAAEPAMMAPAMAPSMTPMAVSGTVTRYYVDRAGFVTAMDVQTAEGSRMIRFSPSMAQSLTAMYPVGSTASVYVTSSMMGAMTRYDLAGVGANMPAPGAMMMPMMVSDVDLLKAEPYTTVGAKLTRYTGNISGFISDPMSGDVLALILDEKTLIRVPRENRLVQASTAPEGITPLLKGADVVAFGYPESPRYGAVSPYETRVIGTGIAVNGRALGRLGFGKVGKKATKALLGFDIPFFGGASPEEVQAMDMGYMTYTTPAPMAPVDTMAPAPAAPTM